MAHHGAPSANAPARAFPAPQGAAFSTAAGATDEPVSSHSSPSRRTSLLSDAADRRNHRVSSSPHGYAAAPGSSSAALYPRRSSSLSSSSRARDPDHHHLFHHHHHHHHHRRSRGDGSVGSSRQTTLQRVATEIRRLARASDVQVVSEEDWSFFEEVMAHEGMQPPPGVVHPSHTLVSTGATGSSSTYRTVRTQSPATDAHLEDYYPPVEEEGEGQEGQDYEGRSSLLASLSHVDSDTESSTSVESAKDVDQQDHSLRGGTERRWKWLSHLPTLPTLYRNILKCSLAYFLGSLFTYYAPLSRFIAELTQDGPGEKYPSAMGHMVATV